MHSSQNGELGRCWYLLGQKALRETESAREDMFAKENNSNGYQQQQQPPPGMGHIHSHRERVRRGTRRSRASRDSLSLRVCEQQQRPPCTDFDMAYFHSYAHLGIHQEMIKV